MKPLCLLILVTIILIIIITPTQSNFDSSFIQPDYNGQKCTGQIKEKYLKDLKIIDNFLTNEECDYIINLAKPKVERSTVMGFKKDEVSNYRTSDHTFMSTTKDPTLRLIAERVSKLVGLPINHQEDLQILRYKDGKYYKPHYDACLDDSDNCKRDRMSRGIRLNTVIMYLSDVEEGGETVFNNLGKIVKPKKGMALVFTPISKDDNGNYEHHVCSYHSAHPPIKGTKWNATIWTRDKNQLNI